MREVDDLDLRINREDRAVSSNSSTCTPARRVHWLPLLLAAVMVLFLGILLLAWIATERADPVMLDDRGEPRGAAPATSRP